MFVWEDCLIIHDIVWLMVFSFFYSSYLIGSEKRGHLIIVSKLSGGQGFKKSSNHFSLESNYLLPYCCWTVWISSVTCHLPEQMSELKYNKELCLLLTWRAMGIEGQHWKAVKFVAAIRMGDDAGSVVFMQISANIPMAITQIKLSLCMNQAPVRNKTG